MRHIVSRLLIIIAFMSGIVLMAQSQQREVIGCLSRAPDATLQFLAFDSGRVFAVKGDMKLLQAHVDHLVAISDSVAENGGTLNAGKIRDVADTCTAVPSVLQAGAVSGKSGIVQTATPITNTATDETTAGFQTETGAVQETGNSARPPSRQQVGVIGPLLPAQAGQTQLQSEINAEAASRAEIYPGITLGVDLKAAPASSTTSILEANQHLSVKNANTGH